MFNFAGFMQHYWPTFRLNVRGTFSASSSLALALLHNGCFRLDSGAASLGAFGATAPGRKVPSTACFPTQVELAQADRMLDLGA